jgi:VanZ family protein
MKKSSVLIVASWVAVAACMGIIFFLSSQNGDDSGNTSLGLLNFLKLSISEEFLRTAAHFLEFTGLSVLIFNALYQTCGRIRPFLSLLLTSAYAVTDEIHQIFVEDRVCDFFDWLIDSLGAASGIAVLCAIIYIFSYFKRRRLS